MSTIITTIIIITVVLASLMTINFALCSSNDSDQAAEALASINTNSFSLL